MRSYVQFACATLIALLITENASAIDDMKIKARTEYLKLYAGGPPNVPNGNVSTVKVLDIDFTASLSINNDGNIELSKKCNDHVPHIPKPPFIYKKVDVYYDDILILLGLTPDLLDDDPSLADPMVTEAIKSATVAYHLQHDRFGLHNVLFVSQSKIACMAFTGDDTFSAMALTLLEDASGGGSSQNEIFAGLTCVGKPYPEDSPFAPLCNEKGQQSSEPRPNTDTSTNKTVDASGRKTPGAGATTSENLEEQISLLLSSGIKRNTEIELLLCAAEHPECRLYTPPVAIRAFLSISTKQEAQLRLIEKLSD